MGSTLTGTRCPNQSPARARNKLTERVKRGRGAVSDGGEGKETDESMKMEERRRRRLEKIWE